MKMKHSILIIFILGIIIIPNYALDAQEKVEIQPNFYQKYPVVIDTTKLFYFPLLHEVKLFAITRWDAGCPDGQRDWWDDMGDAWYNELTSHWPYIQDGRFINGNMADSWFTDSDIVWWGNDHTYADEADVCMICLHGTDDPPSWMNGDIGRWNGLVRIDETGPGNCLSSQADMAFGDLDLEFLHLSSCHSLDDNQWFFEWASSFEGLHQVDGFHG